MSLELWSGNKLTIKPSELEGFIVHEYGIGCQVKLIDGRNTIKVDNHFSLFKLITKIKRKFSFEVYHQKGKNEFILIII